MDPAVLDSLQPYLDPKYLLALLGRTTFRVLLIVVLVYAFIRLMRVVGRRITAYVRDEDDSTQSEQEKRADTLVQVLNAASKIFGITVGAIMVLRELGLNITPLLTGAGIAGLALGLGAQTIVRDFINGFFILMENQFRIGDVINVDGVNALVEKISLRTTHLRDVEGTLHIIPNSEIRVVRNLTHGWSQVRLDVGVSYDEKLERVMGILRQVAADIHRDPAFGPQLLEEPSVLGIEAFGDWQVTVRLLARTKPQRQWDVARELRRRIKEVFDAEGIVIPYPRQVVEHVRPVVEEQGEGRRR